MSSPKAQRKESASSESSAESHPHRPQLDQLLSTRDVTRITGKRDSKQRCTIYRWIRSGTFPPKRAGGGRGWLQPDVERRLGNAPLNR